MFMLNQRDKTPIFTQLKKQILEFIALGILKEDDQLPSVRSLATELGINPNTVSKAYQELELEGYVYTVAGKGCFISVKESEGKIKAMKLDELRVNVETCRRYGIAKNQLLELIDEIYKGGEESC